VDMAIVRVRKDFSLVREKWMTIVRIRKDVTLLRVKGTWL